MNTLSDKSGSKYKDLQDISLYYLSYLEEEAANTESLSELVTLKSKLRDQGCLSTSFNHTSILGLMHQSTSSSIGVGRKRQNTTSIE